MTHSTPYVKPPLSHSEALKPSKKREDSPTNTTLPSVDTRRLSLTVVLKDDS